MPANKRVRVRFRGNGRVRRRRRELYVTIYTDYDLTLRAYTPIDTDGTANFSRPSHQRALSRRMALVIKCENRAVPTLNDIRMRG